MSSPDRPTAPEAPPGADASRLYLALGRLSRVLRRDARESAIGHGGLSALATLVLDGPQRPSVLAETEGITAPAMSRILSSLADLGYLERRPDPKDGRASVVEATAAGVSLVHSGREARQRALQARIDRLPPRSRALLHDALGALEDLSGPDPSR